MTICQEGNSLGFWVSTLEGETFHSSALIVPEGWQQLPADGVTALASGAQHLIALGKCFDQEGPSSVTKANWKQLSPKRQALPQQPAINSIKSPTARLNSSQSHFRLRDSHPRSGGVVKSVSPNNRQSFASKFYHDQEKLLRDQLRQKDI